MASTVEFVPRPLHVWEAISSVMSVAMSFELEGPVTEAAVKEAFAAVRVEHPYLGMVLEGQFPMLQFRAVPDQAVQLECVSAASCDWQHELFQMGNTPRDHSKATTYLRLVSCSGDKHHLFVVMNHGGCDALGMFAIYNTMLTHLGALAAGQRITPGAPRQFKDIMARIPADVADQPRPEVPEVFMPKLEQVGEGEREALAPAAHAIWDELDAATTAALLRRCKAHGATVQGAISLAAMVAMARISPGCHLPQVFLNQAPANLRKQVDPPLDAEDCACASSFLWWPQPLAPGDRLWDAAAAATAAVRDAMNNRGGLAFWHRIGQPEPWTPEYTVTASSVGVNPIGTRYGPVGVERVHMLAAAYGMGRVEDAVVMTHAHTFAGRLHTTFAYSQPGVGSARAALMAATQQAVLRALASEEGEAATVAQFLA